MSWQDRQFDLFPSYIPDHLFSRVDFLFSMSELTPFNTNILLFNILPMYFQGWYSIKQLPY